jgi:hypothetical protein
MSLLDHSASDCDCSSVGFTACVMEEGAAGQSGLRRLLAVA